MSREAFQSALENFRDNHTEALRKFFILSGLAAAAEPNQSDEKVKREIALLCPVNYVESRNWVELGCVLTKPFFNKLPMVVGHVTDDRVDAIAIKSIFFETSGPEQDLIAAVTGKARDSGQLAGLFPVTHAWDQLASQATADVDPGQAYCVKGGPDNLLACTNRDLGLDLVITSAEVKMTKSPVRKQEESPESPESAKSDG
jgi:hypothetical protein